MSDNSASPPGRFSRRTFVQGSGGLGAGLIAATLAGSRIAEAQPAPSAPPGATSTSTVPSPTAKGAFWPNGARLAVSLSLMFEAGGQPISGAGGPIGEPIARGLPDLPTNAFFDYGVTEGIPRLLDLFDRHGVRMSSFMIGQAVDKAPQLAREIVARGHEAAAHGRTWSNSYALSPADERRFIADCVASIERATGVRPLGWNAYWMRNTVHTLEILQDLGFLYHIDDPSRDEPFLQTIKGAPFVTVPYTMHMNDIVSFGFEGFSAAAYEQALRDEFDQLYDEAASRPRMMVVSLHDRISGHANRVRALDRFLTYARARDGVWFARKDEIARWTLAHPDLFPAVSRGPAGISGLPGSAG